jgi:hypothetical protein
LVLLRKDLNALIHGGSYMVIGKLHPWLPERAGLQSSDEDVLTL